MWESSQSLKINADKNVIWEIWSNVSKWCEWDKGIESSSISGAFKTGTIGKIQPKNGPPVDFKLDIKPLSNFTSISQLPENTTLSFIHLIREISPNQVEITHTIKIVGDACEKFGNFLGKKLADDLLPAMQNLASIAEKA